MRYLNLRRTLWFIAMGLLISGCAGPAIKTDKAALTPDDRNRQFDQEYYRTFNRVNKALQNEGYAIETADSENGLIYTDFKLASTVGAPIGGNHQVKVEAVLKRNDTGTRVTLTLRVRQEIAMTGGKPAGVSQAEAKRYYEELFKSISAQVGN